MMDVSTGKCAGKSSVTRISTRGNTLLPSTLTLLIGLRVTHSWGCMSVCVGRARQTPLLTLYSAKHQPALTSLTNYLLCHEILEIVFVLGWCSCARTNH